LDRTLERALPEVTRSRIKRWVELGLVSVSGERVKAGYRLREGDAVTVEIPPDPAIAPAPEELPLTVVHEDDDLVVVDTAAGLVVHPGAGRPGGTLVNALLGRGIPLSPVGAPARPGIVHRLDKGTSGLLVVAKTGAAHLALSRALAAREVNRRYWAVVWGSLPSTRGRIEAPLARSRSDRRKMTVVRDGGRSAATRWDVLWEGERVTALALALETGRTHQIRAHLAHRGNPVFGDPEYGGRGGARGGSEARSRVRAALARLPRQALHAARLEFTHPTTGRRMSFTSSLPEDIEGAADALAIPPPARCIPEKENA
jgi:23S rRNA pseudouridine1911/1915/1917 synthase